MAFSRLFTDTLAPPPSSPVFISGPSGGCVGQTSQFSSDFAVGCTPMWYVNDSLMQGQTGLLTVTWWESGNNTVSLYQDCGSGTEFLDSLTLYIGHSPEVYLGNDTVINEGDSVILDAGNPGASYLWSTGDSTQSIIVKEAGTYWATVTNYCGSNSDTITVDVMTAVSNSNGNKHFRLVLSGNYLFVQSDEIPLERFFISDLSGKIIFSGNSSHRIYFPYKGIFLITLYGKGHKTGTLLFFK